MQRTEDVTAGTTLERDSTYHAASKRQLKLLTSLPAARRCGLMLRVVPTNACCVEASDVVLHIMFAACITGTSTALIGQCSRSGKGPGTTQITHLELVRRTQRSSETRKTRIFGMKVSGCSQTVGAIDERVVLTSY